MTDRYEKIRKALSHEIWAAAQLAPGEGIVDGATRVEALLRKTAHPAITYCDNCGCDWLDNGLNPVGCPYCKQSDDAKILVAERDALEAENERLQMEVQELCRALRRVTQALEWHAHGRCRGIDDGPLLGT